MPKSHALFKPTAEDLKKLPRERAIRAFFQSNILTGVLAKGTALPPMLVLAKLWESNYFTVHCALTPLVKEGLLQRHKGVGTYVSGTHRKLATVGIYYGVDIISNPQHGYAIQLHRLLHETFRKQGLKVHTWLDPRDLKETAKSILPEINWAIEHQEIQAMVAIMTQPEHFPLFSRLPVPVAYFSNATNSHNVYFPHREFLLKALQHCREAGRRNVALIASPTVLTTSGRKHDWSRARAYSVFANLCGQLGLGTHRKWFHMIDSGNLTEEQERKQILAGYDSLLRDGKSRPDALIVYPDNNLVTLHQALAARNGRLDESLFILSHRNEPPAFLMPEGPCYISLSLHSVAAGLSDLIREATQGKPCASRPGELVESA